MQCYYTGYKLLQNEEKNCEIGILISFISTFLNNFFSIGFASLLFLG